MYKAFYMIFLSLHAYILQELSINLPNAEIVTSLPSPPTNNVW